jgi:hypothetical protein
LPAWLLTLKRHGCKVIRVSETTTEEDREMAQFVTYGQAREFEIDGKTYDLIGLIEALERTPEGWVSPEKVTDLKVGQIVHVWALGDRLRRGVVAKLGRTKAVVVFTTQSAVDWAQRHGALSDASIRVADTPVRLSQIKVPAVQTADGPVPVTVLPEPEADREETSPEDLTPNSQDCKVTGDSEDEPEGDEMNATTTETAPATTPVSHTGSTVVKTIEKVWDRIRADHPELPEVVVTTGSGEGVKWGHFRPESWKRAEDGTKLHEFFLASEALAKGAHQVLQTTIHEAAHTLNRVRGVQDTSRQGRWHNAQFRKTAEELGLEHPASQADKSHGFSFVKLTEATKVKYADLLAELNEELKLTGLLPWFLGGADEEDERGGEKIAKPKKGEGEDGETKTRSGNLKATCSCPDPLIIRLSRKVLDLGVVRCDECEELFTAA